LIREGSKKEASKGIVLAQQGFYSFVFFCMERCASFFFSFWHSLFVFFHKITVLSRGLTQNGKLSHPSLSSRQEEK